MLQTSLFTVYTFTHIPLHEDTIQSTWVLLLVGSQKLKHTDIITEFRGSYYLYDPKTDSYMGYFATSLKDEKEIRKKFSDYVTLDLLIKKEKLRKQLADLRNYVEELS